MALTTEQERVLGRYADKLIELEPKEAEQSALALAIAAKKAEIAIRLAPLRKPLIDAVATLDAQLEAVQRTAAFRDARRAVAEAFAALSKAGTDEAKAVYQAAVAARDALMAPAHAAYETKKKAVLPALEAEEAKAAAELEAVKRA